MNRSMLQALIISIIILVIEILIPNQINAQETIRYSCSNQVYNALEKEKIEAFTKATGIKIDVYTSSSRSAITRMMNGYSDIASTASSLSSKHKDYGYTQISICRDPHRLKPVSHAFSVAVLAASTHLGAARDWIPGCFRPFDSRCHATFPGLNLL